MMNEMVESIEIGNLVQKVSLSLYEDIANLLRILPAMTAELRAQKLKENSAKYRLKLERLLSICKWLKMPGVKSQLESVRGKELQGRDRRSEFDQILDALYYFHADLYPKRVRTSEVSIAKEVLARGDYPFLPEGMLGKENEQSETPDPEKEETTRREIDLYIRAKLALDEKIPEECDSCELVDGVLVLRRTNLFQVAFTLAYPDREASWKPLNFQVLTKFVNEGLPDKSSHVNVLELKVIDALLKIYLASIPDGSARVPLEQQWGICYHMSMMYTLRMFYVQSLLNTRQFSSVRSESTFNNEDVDKNVLIHRFWESREPSQFRFELQIAIYRPMSKRSSVELFLIKSEDSSQGKSRIQLKDFRCDLKASIDNGDISSLYDRAREFCGDILLRMLYARLSCCDIITRAAEKGIKISLKESSVELALDETKLLILVDPRSGQFTLSSTLLGTLGTEVIDIGDKFLKEINGMFYSKKLWSIRQSLIVNVPEDGSGMDMDVASESTSVISGGGSGGSDSIVTVEGIIQYMVLAHWSSYFEMALSLKTKHSICLEEVKGTRMLYFQLQQVLNVAPSSHSMEYQVYFSIHLDMVQLVPVCQAYICQSRKDAFFDMPTVLSCTVVSTPRQKEQTVGFVECNNYWDDLLVQTYRWASSSGQHL